MTACGAGLMCSASSLHGETRQSGKRHDLQPWSHQLSTTSHRPLNDLTPRRQLALRRADHIHIPLPGHVTSNSVSSAMPAALLHDRPGAAASRPPPRSVGRRPEARPRPRTSAELKLASKRDEVSSCAHLEKQPLTAAVAFRTAVPSDDHKLSLCQICVLKDWTMSRRRTNTWTQI